MKLNHLWNWHGTIGRQEYLLWGALLFAGKWNLDRFVLNVRPDGHPISFVDYFQAGFPASTSWTPESMRELGWVVLLSAIPFLWAGVVLTVQRLRAARLPLWLAVLFVVPVLKWVLFLVAMAAPGRAMEDFAKSNGCLPTWLDRFCPRSRSGSAVAGVASACALLWLATLFGTQGLGQYGWGLFLGLPFVAGFLAAFIYGAHESRRIGESLAVAALAVLIGALGFVALAIEGIICVVIAAPLAVPLALVGAVLGNVVSPGHWRQGAQRMLCAGVLAVPLMLCSERLADAPAPLLKVKSSLDVAARRDESGSMSLPLTSCRLRPNGFSAWELHIHKERKCSVEGLERCGIACSPPDRSLSQSKFGRSPSCFALA